MVSEKPRQNTTATTTSMLSDPTFTLHFCHPALLPPVMHRLTKDCQYCMLVSPRFFYEPSCLHQLLHLCFLLLVSCIFVLGKPLFSH